MSSSDSKEWLVALTEEHAAVDNKSIDDRTPHMRCLFTQNCLTQSIKTESIVNSGTRIHEKLR